METIVDPKTGICFTVPEGEGWQYKQVGIEWSIWNMQKKLGVFVVRIYPDKQDFLDKTTWLQQFLEQHETKAEITETEKFAYAETTIDVEDDKAFFRFWLLTID